MKPPIGAGVSEPLLEDRPLAIIETKDFTFDVKLEELTDDGQFEGYASVFGNEDMDGDVVEKGAFRKTIRESKGRVPILWQHDPWSPIGESLELEEDEHGLRTRGQIVLDTRLGAEAYALLKRTKAFRGLSIGYQTIRREIENRDDGKVVRKLKELKLWEYSLVTFPANTLAVVGNVKTTTLLRDLRSLRSVDPEGFKALLTELAPPDWAPGSGGAAPTDDAPAIATRLQAMTTQLKEMTTR